MILPTAILAAVHLDTKVAVSIVVCLFENQYFKVLLQRLRSYTLKSAYHDIDLHLCK
jgi:hypothetical protein